MDTSKTSASVFTDLKRRFVRDCTYALIFDYEPGTYHSIHTNREIDTPKFHQAFERFADELEIVCDKDFIDQYVLTKLILTYAEKHTRLALAGGCSACSFLSYLYGISNIDTVEYGFPAEVFFSFRMNRKPFFPILVSEGFTTEIILYLIEVFGQKNVSLTNPDIGEITVQYYPRTFSDTHYELTAYIHEDPFLTLAEKDLVGCYSDAKTFAGTMYEMFAYSGYPFEEDERKLRKLLVELIDIAEDPEDDIRSDKKHFLKTVFDKEHASDQSKRFAILVDAIAMIKGKGLWQSSQFLREAGADIPCTREDLYHRLTELTGERETAFELMERVRKGQGIKEADQKWFPDEREAQALLEYCNGVQYMVSETIGISYANLLCYLASM